MHNSVSTRFSYLVPMKLSLSLICMFSLFFQLKAGNQPSEIKSLRDDYVLALKDVDLVEEVYERFLKVEEPSAKILAYRGALEAIMTKTTWNFFKKLDYLKKSEKSFAEAVKKDPESVEVRFMRMAVQYEIPSYLGFSNDIPKDRDFIVANIHRFDPQGLDDFTLNRIIAFMKKCNRFTESQIARFENILAYYQ